MEEIKTEVQETPEEVRDSNKKKVKSFKMNEAQVDRVNELLKRVEGGTDADKLIESLELAIKQSKMPDLPSNLNKSYLGDREKIATALHMINMTFESLMLSTSETISIREEEIKVAHNFEVDELLKKQDQLQIRIKTMQELLIKAQEDCEAAQQSESNMKQEIEAVQTDMELKNKFIEGLTQQLEESKAEMTQIKADAKSSIEEVKLQVAKKDTEIAELVTDSRKYKEKIEILEAKNEELLTKSNESQQVNHELTGKLSVLEVNYQNEQAKNEDLKARIAQLQAELTQERANTSQIQLQFMQLMSSKDNAATAKPENKPSINAPKKFKLTDEKGKIVWEGNKSELIKHANQFQKETKVNGSTDISVIEEIFAPLILKY